MSPVKVVRKTLLMTQLELSKILGVSRTMINSYEKGIYKPGNKVLKKLFSLAQQNGIQISIWDFYDKE